jgi:hypothetical protein
MACCASCRSPPPEIGMTSRFVNLVHPNKRNQGHPKRGTDLSPHPIRWPSMVGQCRGAPVERSWAEAGGGRLPASRTGTFEGCFRFFVSLVLHRLKPRACRAPDRPQSLTAIGLFPLSFLMWLGQRRHRMALAMQESTNLETNWRFPQVPCQQHTTATQQRRGEKKTNKTLSLFPLPAGAVPLVQSNVVQSARPRGLRL